jgi:hypothetical protein
MDRRRIVVLLLAMVAVALAAAGVVVWREMSPSVAAQMARCTGGLACGAIPPYHLHPVRAELLWAAAGLAGLLAIVVALRPRLHRGGTVPVSG